ncbi:MAG: methyltransferase [Bacteroidia bacterium]|nr:methyltransferase [Bacteroidia bacterium]
MKVGTDGVLLGAWTELTGSELRILDVGTGSGVIALMLAQRSAANTHIDAIDIDEAGLEEARLNFDRSPWPTRLHVVHTAVQLYHAERYDLIVSNPPYFINSLRGHDDARNRARHTVSLSYAELIAAAARLLATNGSFNVILPAPAYTQFTDMALAAGLHCRKSCAFKRATTNRWNVTCCLFNGLKAHVSKSRSRCTLKEQPGATPTRRSQVPIIWYRQEIFLTDNQLG